MAIAEFSSELVQVLTAVSNCVASTWFSINKAMLVRRKQIRHVLLNSISDNRFHDSENGVGQANRL